MRTGFLVGMLLRQSDEEPDEGKDCAVELLGVPAKNKQIHHDTNNHLIRMDRGLLTNPGESRMKFATVSDGAVGFIENRFYTKIVFKC